ncbi:MAG: SDR family NAD(P)-dependent oxidoreductase [Solirubrobacteraceae bacterium]
MRGEERTGGAEAQDEPIVPGGALVTGIGHGAGFAVAQALAARGHPVHVTDLDAGVAARAADALGPPSFGSAVDVRLPAACRAAAARTRRRAGSLEVWVNNAGAVVHGPAWELAERTRQGVLEVNLAGMINGTLAALELMRAAGRGQVVNVVALPGLLPAPGQALYSAASHATVAFSLGTLADLQEAGLSSLTVSCLCLGKNLLPERRDGHDPLAAVEASSGGSRLASGLDELLLHPRPFLAIPPWRGTLLRASYVWPGLAPLGKLAAGRTGRGKRTGRP